MMITSVIVRQRLPPAPAVSTAITVDDPDTFGRLSLCQVTDVPVKSQFGWHVIRVDDIREAQLPKLEDVKPQIAQQLQQQKLAAFQENLRKAAKIE